MPFGTLRRKIERLERQQLGAYGDPKVAESVSASIALEKLRDPLVWLQNYTRTKDPHWREVGAASPYSPFPDLPYFRPLLEGYQREPIVFVVKSRDMMLPG